METISLVNFYFYENCRNTTWVIGDIYIQPAFRFHITAFQLLLPRTSYF